MKTMIKWNVAGIITTAFIIAACGEPTLLRSSGLSKAQCESASSLNVCSLEVNERGTTEQIQISVNVPPSTTQANQAFDYALEYRADTSSSWQAWDSNGREFLQCQSGLTNCTSPLGSVSIEGQGNVVKKITMTHSIFTSLSGIILRVRAESNGQYGPWLELDLN